MKKFLASMVLLALLGSGIAFAINRSTTSSTSNDKVSVAASFYPLYDFAKNVGRGQVSAVNITPAGAEPHDYEPSPKTLANAQKSDVFIYNGAHMEPWVDGFLQDYKHTSVKASRGVDLRKATDEEDPNKQVQDPHFWLDPVLAQHIVAIIRDGLIKADPTHKAEYTKNAAVYTAKLAQLDKDFQAGLASCQTRTIITSHDAFSYLAQRYNLQVVSIAGISPDEEPSAQKLAELSKLVEDKHIKYVFFESLVSPRLADTIAAEAGANTLVFDPIEGLSNDNQKQGKNYLSVQRQNLANLRTALACQ
ncbi:MAG TPA: zinc ABC transporter substrate-binding protein [Nevskiaceae bacterium]|nr:zinc ABC transporter substrate-binding protein [Nevskiaceae bacterium]